MTSEGCFFVEYIVFGTQYGVLTTKNGMDTSQIETLKLSQRYNYHRDIMHKIGTKFINSYNSLN